MISRIIRSIPISISSSTSASNHYNNKNTSVAVVVSRKKDLSAAETRSSRRRNRRHLVTLSTGEGKWQGNWTSQFLISLKDLDLQDLIEDHHHHQKEKDGHQVCVTLTVEKHASFGLSVDGRIQSSFPRYCANCYSPYSRQIDTNFKAWVLMSNNDDEQLRQLPQIGGDDPSVIYVKPGGCEANLDSLIQDTLRLTVSVQDFCSEACENSEPSLQFIGRQSTASIDKRWSPLLHLKDTTTNQLPHHH